MVAFTGEVLSAVSAVDLDVTVIHAQQADASGNVQLWGIVGVQKEAVLCARRVLVTVEDRRRANSPAGCDRAAALDDQLRRRDPTAPTRRTPTATPSATTTSTSPGTRSAGIGPASARGWRTMSSSAEQRATAAPDWSPAEMMTVAASRALRDGATCLVGIGLPSTAANLARRTHSPGLVLIYESGTIGTKPGYLRSRSETGSWPRPPTRLSAWPRSSTTGCNRGASTSACSAPLRSTASRTSIPPRSARRTSPRSSGFPGAGGAPEIAASCAEVIIVVRQSRERFVERVDFVTSLGHGSGGDERRRLGLRGGGPTAVITDLGVLEPDPETRELVLTGIHPGVDVDAVREATGWELRVAQELRTTAPPSDDELLALRRLEAASPGAAG